MTNDPSGFYDHAMDALDRVREHYPQLSDQMRTIRSSVPALVSRISAQILDGVGTYAATGERRREVVETAVLEGVGLFVDLLEGLPVACDRVDEVFRRMGGSAESRGPAGIDLIRAASQVATTSAWHELRQAADELGLPPEAIGSLGDVLFAFLQHLVDQVDVGFNASRNTRDPEVIRRRLAEAVLRGAPADDVRAIAVAAAWPLPAKCVVVSADLVRPRLPIAPADDRRVLCRVTERYVSMIVDASQSEAAVEALGALPITGPIAMSWPVPTDEAHHAARWTRRAIRLSRQGLIASAEVIDCANYRSALWLHADPALGRGICDEVLAPLMREKPYVRAGLAETLLLWLRSRASAPALANVLKVHDQTVRRRMRRLKVDFASALADPDQRMTLLMVLEAVTPVWLTEAGRASHLGHPQVADALAAADADADALYSSAHERV
ncbi:helix-turn-helix domain-containing protein [Mumia sp. ZJ430]|uniref:PucR family transcriptional regulator n=1 Tax=Mumia sp. ZJ430 TaxID=2708083 RepID=UPI001422E066|nr:helix-turn-helix domain-containing protein [Mumia sp. ZJ430]